MLLTAVRCGEGRGNSSQDCKATLPEKDKEEEDSDERKRMRMSMRATMVQMMGVEALAFDTLLMKRKRKF